MAMICFTSVDLSQQLRQRRWLMAGFQLPKVLAGLGFIFNVDVSLTLYWEVP